MCRKIDLGLGVEMDNTRGLVFVKQGIYVSSIAKIGVAEEIPRGIVEGGQLLEIAGVGKHVDIDDGPVAFGNHQTGQGSTNKAGCASYKNGLQHDTKNFT
jgi:hypothetical protein